MPTLHSPCRSPGCGGYAGKSGYCAAHKVSRKGKTAARGYDNRWKRVRLIQLRRQPLCQDCFDRGVYTAAQEVHHVLPIATHRELRLRLDNLRSLCIPCHGKYTAGVKRRE